MPAVYNNSTVHSQGNEVLGCQRRMEFFELGHDAKSAFAGCRTYNSGEADVSKCFEETFQAREWEARVQCAHVQKSSKKVAKHAGEDVDVQLLVGPMALGPKRQMHRILQMSENRLNDGLPVVGADDVRSGPVVAVGHQDDAPERSLCQNVESCLVELMGEGKVRVVARQFPADDFSKVLAALDVVFDVALDSGTVSSLLAAS